MRGDGKLANFGQVAALELALKRDPLPPSLLQREAKYLQELV